MWCWVNKNEWEWWIKKGNIQNKYVRWNKELSMWKYDFQKDTAKGIYKHSGQRFILGHLVMWEFGNKLDS